MKALFIFLFSLFQPSFTYAQNLTNNTIPTFIINPTTFSQKYKIYTASKEEILYFTDVLPSLNGTAGDAAEKFFRKLLGGVHYVFVPRTQSNYFLALYISPHSPIALKDTDHLTLKDLDLQRVKSDLDYGHPHSSTRIDHLEVAEFLKIYSPKESQQLFGTSLMASYPLNLRGKVWAAQYSRARCFVTLNETAHFYLYIFSTEDYLSYFMDNLKRDLTGDFNFSTYTP